MTKAELKLAVEKHAKDIRAWIRQAPLGSTYAPRPQGNSYPTPTFSQSTPNKHKAAVESNRLVQTTIIIFFTVKYVKYASSTRML